MKLPPFLLLASLCAAQSGSYLTDQFFSGGAVWGPSNDPAMGTQSGVYQTLRYGTSFSYTIPLASQGLTSVSVLLMEPNKTGPGQRVFTVTVNGHQSPPLDLFALTGGKLVPYEVDFLFVAVGQVTVSLNASIGNAVVSAIVVLPPPASVQGAAWGDWLRWGNQVGYVAGGVYHPGKNAVAALLPPSDLGLREFFRLYAATLSP